MSIGDQAQNKAGEVGSKADQDLSKLNDRLRDAKAARRDTKKLDRAARLSEVQPLRL